MFQDQRDISSIKLNAGGRLQTINPQLAVNREPQVYSSIFTESIPSNCKPKRNQVLFLRHLLYLFVLFLYYKHVFMSCNIHNVVTTVWTGFPGLSLQELGEWSRVIWEIRLTWTHSPSTLYKLVAVSLSVWFHLGCLYLSSFSVDQRTEVERAGNIHLNESVDIFVLSPQYFHIDFGLFWLLSQLEHPPCDCISFFRLKTCLTQQTASRHLAQKTLGWFLFQSASKRHFIF